MPTAAARPCLTPGCPALVARGRCPAHGGLRPAWDHGGLSSSARGYGAPWRGLRRATLERDSYLCVACGKRGQSQPATEVDHVTPKARGGRDDTANTQSLCRRCHAEKTAREWRRLP